MSAAKDYQDKKEAFAQARIGWARTLMATNEEIGAEAALDAAVLALMVEAIAGARSDWLTKPASQIAEALLKGEELEKPT